MFFKNREEAAHLLIDELSSYQDKNPLILAIPRGAVPMAAVIAKGLGGEMDVVLVRKLGAPNQPELAIGAIDESGEIHLNEIATQLQISNRYLTLEKEQQLNLLNKRSALYRSVHPWINPIGRMVIVVDDGMATGATMAAALGVIREKKPLKLIAAAAVASLEAFQLIQPLADELVFLEVSNAFHAVGQFFNDFSQVTDEEVISILKKSI
jgi:putative phosphoribosyl transferase